MFHWSFIPLTLQEFSILCSLPISIHKSSLEHTNSQEVYIISLSMFFLILPQKDYFYKDFMFMNLIAAKIHLNWLTMTCVAIDLLNIQVTLRASAVVFVLLCHVWLCLLPLLQWPPQDNFPGAELYIEAKVVLLTYFPKWRHPPATPPTGHDFAKSSICDFTTQRSTHPLRQWANGVHQYYHPALGHIGSPQIPGPPEDDPSELIHSSTLLRLLDGSGIKNASLSLPACSAHPVTEAAAHELSLFSTLSVKPRSLPQRRAGSRLAHCCSCFPATLM